MISLEQSEQLLKTDLRALPLAERARLAAEIVAQRDALKQQNQLYFYQPVSPEARKIHLSTKKEIITTGGNRSSKSDSHLVEAIIQMTGIVPLCLEHDYPKEKLRAPIRARLVCNSLTNTWESVLKPKLQYFQWNGRGVQGGPHGHWGWIPPSMLIRGKWEESWSAQFRTLTLANGSSLQIASYDQDVENFAGGSYHLILHDEGPPEPIYRENKMRTMDVAGRLMTAMTPPDDESTAWDAAWVYDQLYEKGQPGPGKDPDIDAFTLFTTDNRILEPGEIARIEKNLSLRQREVRLKGTFLHLSGRIYSIYTDRPQIWCFSCNDVAFLNEGRCVTCESIDVCEFCHFTEPFETAYHWPTVFLLDPHPRKANMMSWVAVDPNDDWWQILELAADDSPDECKKLVDDLEREYGLDVVKRIIDPNMGESPAHNAGRRHVTVRKEWDDAGLRCDLADDNFTVGMGRLKSAMKPDPRTKAPRLHVFDTCPLTNKQIKGYTWQEWRPSAAAHKDPKAMPMDKEDDFPTLLRYFANLQPTFSGLRMGQQVVRRADSGRNRQYRREKRAASRR